MRSTEKNKKRAAIKLEHDIRNTLSHIYGDHTRCSEFCKAKLPVDKTLSSSKEDDNNEESENLFEMQSSFWSEGTSLDAEEDSRKASNLSMTDLQSGMRKDIAFILDNVAKKSESLISNSTSNLAEMWMHLRTKYDGGKIHNHCNKGSWHTRCYAASLRFNKGVQWSPKTWETTTSSSPGYFFTKLYQQRKQCLDNNTSCKAKPEIKKSRYKRKMQSVRESNCKKARKHYGDNSVQVEQDISGDQLEKEKQSFINNNILISDSAIDRIENQTKNQSFSKEWREARTIRLTASNFGQVIKRKTTIPVAPLVLQLLEKKFQGNSITRQGLNDERITIREYIEEKARHNIKTNIEKLGLIIDKNNKFLAASADGKATETSENETSVGLIEIKNVLYRKEITLEEATKSVKNFCLELVNDSSRKTYLKLKRSHNYYYQCQGLLNICNFPWLDFIVRTTNPYQLHIERVFKDTCFWQNEMQPKLSAFYHNAVLPELACPRRNKYPGIREPGNWYVKESASTRIQENPSTSKGVKADGNHSPDTTVVKKRTSRKCSKLKFLGRKISHEWLEEDNSSTWYTGTVTAVLRKKDGDKDAEYEVLYDGHEEANIVDHLLEDYENGSLKFLDI